jgi:hypothetical protein
MNKTAPVFTIYVYYKADHPVRSVVACSLIEVAYLSKLLYITEADFNLDKICFSGTHEDSEGNTYVFDHENVTKNLNETNIIDFLSEHRQKDEFP